MSGGLSTVTLRFGTLAFIYLGQFIHMKGQSIYIGQFFHLKDYFTYTDQIKS